MVTDEEGFAYPQVDGSRCVQCGLCERVCPTLRQAPPRMPLAVYAARAVNEELRMNSSSGGLFSLLAKVVLDEGGVVCGAAFDHSDWHVYHRMAENGDDLAQLRGSKYVQSDMGDCYKAVKSLLSKGREVLFSGTPCQIAGLKNLIGLTNHALMDRLLLVEVVCHAVPSPLAWRKYLEKRVETCYNSGVGGLGQVRRIASRRKNCGWKRFSMSLGFASGMEYRAVFNQDSFMRGFLSELYNRPSCHNCPCKNLKSGSDITIADYWGVASKFPEMDDDKGTSLVLVNTENGRIALGQITSQSVMRASDYEHACRTNPAIISSTKPHRNRSRFFENIRQDDFDRLVRAMLRPSLLRQLRTKLGSVLRRIVVRK